MHNLQRIVLDPHLLMGFNQNSVITSSAFKSMIGGKGGGGGNPPPGGGGDTGGTLSIRPAGEGNGVTITGLGGLSHTGTGTITLSGDGNSGQPNGSQ